MKCLVFAYSQLGHDCLRYLVEHTSYSIAAVVTHDDNPIEHIWFDSAKDYAKAHNIPVFTPLTLNDSTIQAQLAVIDADVILSFYYRHMIPEAVLAMQRLGAYNMHGSLLPKYRGRCPVNWAIIHGESETGVTLHHMVKAADAGDIVDQASTVIMADDTAGTVTKRLNMLAVDVLARNIDLIAERKAPRHCQKADEATYFGGRKPADGAIDWSWSAQRIHNLIRALQPSPQYPPAFGVLNDMFYTFWKSEHVTPEYVDRECVDNIVANEPRSEAMPGVLIKTREPGIFYVSCGENGQETIIVYATST